MRAGSVILLAAREQQTPSDLLQGVRSTPQTILHWEEPSSTSEPLASDPQGGLPTSVRAEMGLGKGQRTGTAQGLEPRRRKQPPVRFQDLFPLAIFSFLLLHQPL